MVHLMKDREGSGPATMEFAPFAAIVTCCTIAAFHLLSYSDALGAFFYLDDYWELTKTHSISIESVGDIVKLFEPFPSFLLYRPISTLVFYHLLRVAFGYDPFAYHATLMAFHVFNGLLVFIIGRHLFRSHIGAFLTASIYAMAPGHAIAVYWMALFTMTGTAFFYFSALAAWFCVRGSWRWPSTFLLFLVAVLSSEHAISLPLILTLSSLLLEQEPDWRRIVRTQAPFYAIAVAYAAVKLYYIRYFMPIQPGPAYQLAFDPANILQQLGRYVGFGFNLAYNPERSDETALALGTLVLIAAITGFLATMINRRVGRDFKLAVWGLVLFILALGPVICLPNHQQSYYIGIAGLGLAVTVVALTRLCVSGPHPYLVTSIVTATLLITHVSSTNALVHRTEQFRLFAGGSESAAGWLYTIWQYAEAGKGTEFFVPADPVTHQVFGKSDGRNQAYTFLICPWYEVIQSPDLNGVPPGQDRVVLSAPWNLPQERSARRSWAWMRVACPDCEGCGMKGIPCPGTCYRQALQRSAKSAPAPPSDRRDP